MKSFTTFLQTIWLDPGESIPPAFGSCTCWYTFSSSKTIIRIVSLYQGNLCNTTGTIYSSGSHFWLPWLPHNLCWTAQGSGTRFTSSSARQPALQRPTTALGWDTTEYQKNPMNAAEMQALDFICNLFWISVPITHCRGSLRQAQMWEVPGTRCWDRSNARDSPGQEDPARAQKALRSHLKSCFKMKTSATDVHIKPLFQSHWHKSALHTNHLGLTGGAAGDVFRSSSHGCCDKCHPCAGHARDGQGVGLCLHLFCHWTRYTSLRSKFRSCCSVAMCKRTRVNLRWGRNVWVWFLKIGLNTWTA